MAVDVGDEAPDFELPDQDRAPVRLSSFRGSKNVVLVFYPLSFTAVCQGELCAIRDGIEDFRGDDVITLAVSCDSTAVHKRWAEEHGFTFPLLADFWPHGEVARTYGVLDEASGLALRGTFVIGKDGRVAYKVVNAIPDARDANAYRTVLATL
ncbi:MAG: alkyl hydroperoxide reductase/Thiol specific antioxidant/Mal allergen [Frankiales bacterium]|jgi:peroxiredoxin|nr:alkyl hydroperoxide reductase/Thiol specific antioxidant/Mal allergen [Frankiales bacterium]